MGCNGCNGCNGTGAKREEESVSRRKLLGWLVGVINVGVLGALVTPTLGFIAAPLRRKKDPAKWVPVLDAAELQDGETRHVIYTLNVQDGYMVARRNYSVYVSRRGSKVVAFDPTCPHLGCHVEFKDRKKRFVCPCHGGTFDEDGNRISGPPPHGLTKVAAKVEAGQVWVYKV